MRNNKKLRVAFIIPAYNEATAIKNVISGIKSSVKELRWDWEIIVIDDCSTDHTAKVSRGHKVTVIKHLLNAGSGGATYTGIRYARDMGFDIAVTLDGDGQHNPNDAVVGVKRLQRRRCDLLVGSRLVNPKGMSNAKRIGNRGLSFITRIVFGVRVTDSQSGLRVFSTRALKTLDWKTSSYDFCSEMLWRAKQQRLTIEEYPIKAIYSKYSIAKGQNNWNAFNIIKSLIRTRMMEVFGE